jgi:hypothetical protein
MRALQHRTHQLGQRGQQDALRGGQEQHPLAHWPVEDDVIDPVRCRLRHSPRTACRAEPPSLAAERLQPAVGAVVAA